MAKISGTETKPEIVVRKYLNAQGFRFRKNDTRYPGKPDILMPKYKSVIFVHGCFWHGHNCKAAKIPDTRTTFWKEKIEGNVKRDEVVQQALTNMGWKVIIVWQCQLKNFKLREQRLMRLIEELFE